MLGAAVADYDGRSTEELQRLHGRSLVQRRRHYLVGAVRLGLVRIAEEGLSRRRKFSRRGFHGGSRHRPSNDGWRCSTRLDQHDGGYSRRKACAWRVGALASLEF